MERNISASDPTTIVFRTAVTTKPESHGTPQLRAEVEEKPSTHRDATTS